MKVKIDCPYCAGKGAVQEAGKWPTCPMCNGQQTLIVDAEPVTAEVQVLDGIEIRGEPNAVNEVVAALKRARKSIQVSTDPVADAHKAQADFREAVDKVFKVGEDEPYEGHREALGRQELDGGVKHDRDKPPMGLLPMAALQSVAQVLGFGAKKYAPGNWRKVKPRSRYLDAALRHIAAFEQEDLDPESNLPHLAHAACCLLFLLTFYLDDEECRH